MFAIIRTGGKQYRVRTGDFLDVEKLNAGQGQPVAFDNVLLIDDDNETLIGTPLLEKALVKGEVVEQHRDGKILVFKKKRRKQFRRTRGHRQALTKVRILAIYADRNGAPIQEFTPPPPPPTVKPEVEPPAAAEAVSKAPVVKVAKAKKEEKAAAKAAKSKPKAGKSEAAKAKGKEPKIKTVTKKTHPAKPAAKPKE
jgi:large subunit ribosomal protein L21